MSPVLAAVRYRQGRLLGRMEALGIADRAEATLSTLAEDALRSSEIEGEMLDRGQLRSSLALRLGLQRGGLPIDRKADAIAAVVLDATRNFAAALTQERLFEWHTWLFPQPDNARHTMTIGGWRTDEHGPMQVVSGQAGREKVHFEAPAASRVAPEMARFLSWLAENDAALDPVLKAVIAHLWFVTIHPFDDGNGRIGRAIMDLALARSEGTGQRCYSMSARLRVERADYYAGLEAAQKGTLEVTSRLLWFLRTLDQALQSAETTIAATLRKARLWNSAATVGVNPRQRLLLNRLLDGFEGKLTSSKWAKIAKCSQDTALRDIDELLVRGLLIRNSAGGRSTHYDMAP